MHYLHILRIDSLLLFYSLKNNKVKVMYFKPLALFSCALLFNACSHLPDKSVKPLKAEIENQALQLRDRNLKQKVQDYTLDQSLFDVAFDDLNQDGQDDAIVLLKGQNWCGSGGCAMLIFKGKASQNFDFVSKTTLVDNPIYSTTYTQSGWKQLLVYSRKHGQVMLKFDGVKYPLNPSLLPLHVGKLAPDTVRLLFGENH